jgi:hypothetical protein
VLRSLLKPKRTAAHLEGLLLQRLCAEPGMVFAGVSVIGIPEAAPGQPNWEAHIIGLEPAVCARAQTILRELLWDYDLA